MQALTTYTGPNLTISSPNETLVLKLATLAINSASTPAAANDIPAIGVYWPGQGGIYGGILQYPDGLHHIIYGAKDLGDFVWGGRGTETGATCKTDGRLNTAALVEALGVHSAAKAASEYSSDGHHDFYLPSIGELNHAWQNIPNTFDNSTWYWSSTQRSAYFAFTMYFDVGGQTSYGKTIELRVRPVRRLPIQ